VFDFTALYSTLLRTPIDTYLCLKDWSIDSKNCRRKDRASRANQHAHNPSHVLVLVMMHGNKRMYRHVNAGDVGRE